MSFHPFVSRWYFAMPSTIAGESCGAYSFAVTVWCTNVACTTPKRGAARGGTVSAPHAARGTIGGGLPGWTPPACAARAADRAPRACAAAARRRAPAGGRGPAGRPRRGAPARRGRHGDEVHAQRPARGARQPQLQLVRAAG